MMNRDDVAKLTYEDADGFKTIVNLYEMDGYGYCEIATYISSSAYYQIYKFNLSDMDSVLYFVTDNICENLDAYLEQLDGAELILYDSNK